MSRFFPLDLQPFFNLTRDPREWQTGLAPWPPAAEAAEMAKLPAGPQTFWGIPFQLGPAAGLSWLWLGRGDGQPGHGGAGSGVTIEIPAAAPEQPAYVVCAHFCPGTHGPTGNLLDYGAGDALEPGEHLADYVLLYGDGSASRQPIRRRYEVAEVLIPSGLLQAFAARPHAAPEPRPWQGPYPPGCWGLFQMGVSEPFLAGPARYWLHALPNPYPDRELQALRLEPSSAWGVVLAGITLYCGEEHPLQRRRLESLRVTLPAAMPPRDAGVSVDLGTVARAYAVPAFDPAAWLSQELQGWGEPAGPNPRPELIVDLTASPDATLAVAGEEVPLRKVYAEGAAASTSGAVRVEVLTPHKTWLHARIVDERTGEPVPARVHFRAPDGRYLPPYGHRHEVNDDWFEDYGADLKLGSTPYAYVDGQFQIELPVGAVYVEIAKGFEYRPVRRRLEIQPGQRELTLPLARPLDWRRAGWVTADTHVHFLSPQTACLEAQAEGINLVNLLAAQWGDTFSNIGDLTGGPSGASHDDTLVWVGTENRQHMLGHISLLGGRGRPVYPLSAGGPIESYLGDPLWSSLAEWADRCREREGLVVMPHFPYPYCEAAADLVLGKVDAAELRFFTPTLDSFNLREWYRFLNLGYRVASVGGTDKMTAGVPVGASRTYAYIGEADFSFASWAAAVRAGRTFTTSGPLVDIRVEGQAPGAALTLPERGGTLSVAARAEAVLPFDELQIVLNGQVVARQPSDSGGLAARLETQVRLAGSGWLAARCASRHWLWLGFFPISVGAHTSPVYVRCGSDELFNGPDARYLLTLIDGGLTWLDTLAIPASPEQHARVRGVFTAARDHLEGRLAWHEAHGHA